jgi:hypothetical protein
MKLENYYLDLNKIETLSVEDKKVIHDYYRDMIYSHCDGRTSISDSLFLTLYNNGYLVDIRAEKINNILHEDNSVGS